MKTQVKRHWLKAWTGMVSVALVVAVVLSLLPIGITFDADGMLSIGIRQVEAAGDWLSDWPYRKELPIGNSTASPGTNYQVRWDVYAGNGTDAAGVVYLGEKCEDFPNDIRFTGSDKETLLDHWYETNIGSDSTYRRYWIEVKEDLGSNRDIYIYYGKSGAESLSNGDDTFLFHDDKWGDWPVEQYTGTTYDAFGFLVKTGDNTVKYFYRQGAAHASDKGKIVSRDYTISTGAWSAASTIYEDATYDSRNVGGGIIGSNIYVFFGRYKYDSPTSWIDIGYMKSTDLTGTSWGSYTTIDVSPSTGFSPHGTMAATSNSTTFLQPFYGWYVDGGTTYRQVKVFKTTNSGTSWTVGGTIYSGTTQWTETDIAYIGDSKLIAHLRRSDGGYVGQSQSNDNGENWGTNVNYDDGTVANTNLGASTGVKIPHIYYDADTAKCLALYWDRVNPYTLEISETAASTVFGSPTSWAADTVLYTSAKYLNGYPSLVKVASGKYFYVFSYETSSSDADTYGGNYPLKWTKYGTPTMTLSSGVMRLQASGTKGWNSVGHSLESVATFAAGHRFKGRYQHAGGAGVGNFVNIGLGRHSYNPYSTHCAAQSMSSTAAGTYAFFTEDGSDRSYTDAWSREAGHEVTEILWKTGSVKFTRGSNTGTLTTNTPTSAIPVRFGNDFYQNDATMDIYGDWFFVSKYVDPEPAVGTAGSEESYTVEISNTPSSYAFGTLATNTTAVTGLDYFTITNTGSVTVDIYISGTDMTGTGGNWTLSDTATPGENIYGLEAGLDGGSYNVTVKKTEPHNKLKSSLVASGTQKWGLKMYAPTAYLDSSDKSGNITLEAVASS